MTTAKYRRRARTRVRALTAARLRHRNEVNPVTGSSRTIERVSRRKTPRKRRYSGPRGGGFGSTPTATTDTNTSAFTIALPCGPPLHPAHSLADLVADIVHVVDLAAHHDVVVRQAVVRAEQDRPRVVRLAPRQHRLHLPQRAAVLRP